MTTKFLLMLVGSLWLAGAAAVGISLSDLLLITSLTSIGFFVLAARRQQPG